MTVQIKTKAIDDGGDKNTPSPPDGGWGWVIVFSSFMIHMIFDGITYSFGVFYNEFLNYFHQGESITSWIFSILSGVTMCSGPITSILVNRWGCRLVTIAGAVLAAASLAASYYAQNVYVLYGTIGIGVGLGFGFMYLPAIVTVTVYFEKRRSLATGIAVCGSGVGTFVFAPIVTQLISVFDWNDAMLIVACIVASCSFFAVLFKPLPQEQSAEPESKDLAFSDSLDLQLFKDPGFVIYCISNFLTCLGFNIPYVYIVAKATQSGIESTKAGYLISCIGVANTVSRIVLGYISDHVWVNRLVVYIWCLVVCGLACITCGFLESFYTIAIDMVIFGFTIGSYVGLSSIILVDLIGLDKITTGFGHILLFSGVGTLLGSPIAGWLYDTTQSYEPVFYFSGICIALSGLLLYLIKPLKKCFRSIPQD